MVNSTGIQITRVYFTRKHLLLQQVLSVIDISQFQIQFQFESRPEIFQLINKPIGTIILSSSLSTNELELTSLITWSHVAGTSANSKNRLDGHIGLLLTTAFQLICPLAGD